MQNAVPPGERSIEGHVHTPVNPRVPCEQCAKQLLEGRRSLPLAQPIKSRPHHSHTHNDTTRHAPRIHDTIVDGSLSTMRNSLLTNEPDELHSRADAASADAALSPNWCMLWARGRRFAVAFALAAVGVMLKPVGGAETQSVIIIILCCATCRWVGHFLSLCVWICPLAVCLFGPLGAWKDRLLAVCLLAARGLRACRLFPN